MRGFCRNCRTRSLVRHRLILRRLQICDSRTEMKHRASPLFAIFWMIFLATQAQAFDIEPEYQGLSESKLERIESPRDIDGEYQSIKNGYTVPMEWNRKWARSNRVVDTTIGSLTNQHFLIYTRAKLQTDLARTLQFKFVYAAQQDRETNDSRHVFELSQTILSWLKLNAYAEMAHYKRDNDFGLALIIAPSRYWESRLYATYHDFTRGNHNDQPDRFTSADPLSLGLTSLYDDDLTWIRAGFRFDRSLQWNVPQQQALFGFERKLIFAEASLSTSEKDRISVRTQWDSIFQGRSPTGTSTVPNESWNLDRLIVRTSFSNGLDEDLFSFEYALMYANRVWSDQNGSQVMHQSVLPSVTTRLRGPRRETGFDHIQIAIEATDFRKFGDIELTPADQKNESIEGRLQTAYEFTLVNNARLLMAFNFDLDEWAIVPTFEGGNIQFRSDF